MPETINAQQTLELNLNELFSKHYDKVYSFARIKTQDQHKAADLTSETFIKAYLKIDSYDPSLNFNTWIFTICKNTFLDSIKKKKLNLVYIEDHSNFDSSGTSLSPLDKLIIEEQYISFLRKMELLNSNEKQIIQFYFLEGLSYCEITKKLNISYNNARTKLSRAKYNLHRLVVAS